MDIKFKGRKIQHSLKVMHNMCFHHHVAKQILVSVHKAEQISIEQMEFKNIVDILQKDCR
jgi:5S rRNA maturation endonuclease (ribonuclease M5)